MKVVKLMIKKILLTFVVCICTLSLTGCGDSKDIYNVAINIKDMGTIEVELDAKEAPITVKNFVKLVKEGFYDGLTFHRVIEGFMIQGGDPKANGLGGSGKTITGEFSENGIKNNISHERGVISMARAGNDNNSASSQFFIVHQDSQESLDGKYAAFGHVTKGMEIVDEIAENTPSDPDDGYVNKKDQPVIESIKLLED